MWNAVFVFADVRDLSMTHNPDTEVRATIGWELGQHRSTVPGVLAAWCPPQAEQPVRMKEVIAILRPERWTETKARLQRLRVPAFTQQCVLGRGRARGLRYLPRQGAARHVGIRYLPKRMVSWIVEDVQVAPLIQAIMEVNRTGRIGDGKIFVLPIGDALRIRTGERGLEAIRSLHPAEIVIGTPQHSVNPPELAHASGQ